MKIFDKLIEEHFASEPPEIKPDRSLELLEEQYDNLIASKARAQFGPGLRTARLQAA